MRESGLLFFALFLALALRVASAQTVQECGQQGLATILAPWYCGQINQAAAGIWYQWAPVGVAAVLAAFMIAAVMLMIGIAIQHKRLREFATGELYEAIATAIIVVMFLSISATLFGILPSFFTGPVNPYATALSYISSIINVTQTTIRNLYNVVMIQSFYSSVTLKVSVGKVGVITGAIAGAVQTLFNPLAKLLPAFFIIPATIIAGLLLDGLLALTAQFYMILFFMYLALPVFLIPGIIMRAIFPLRAVGGMMVAVAISFYLVMPVLFSIAYFFTNTNLISSLSASGAAIASSGQGSGAETNAASPTAPLVVAINGLQSAMGAYFLSILFYPALILALTYFSMTTIAEFVGGVSKMSGKLSLL